LSLFFLFGVCIIVSRVLILLQWKYGNLYIWMNEWKGKVLYKDPSRLNTHNYGARQLEFIANLSYASISKIKPSKKEIEISQFERIAFERVTLMCTFTIKTNHLLFQIVIDQLAIFTIKRTITLLTDCMTMDWCTSARN